MNFTCSIYYNNQTKWFNQDSLTKMKPDLNQLFVADSELISTSFSSLSM